MFMKTERMREELDLEIIAAPRIRKPTKRFLGPAAAFVPDSVEQHFRVEYFKILDTVLSQLTFRMEQDGIETYNKLEQCLLKAEVSDACRLYPELDATVLQVQLPMFKQAFDYASTDEAAAVLRSATPEVQRLFSSSRSFNPLAASCSRHVM
jgi:hypothetical protein